MAKRKTTSTPSGDAGAVLERIVAMIDPFCRKHLNEEYAVLCRSWPRNWPASVRPPCSAASPSTWACGIIRTIGWVNFLDDRSTKPHMKLTDIDRAFGVAESTGQGKSKAIRTMFRIHPFDHHWTLPSRMAEYLDDLDGGGQWPHHGCA